MKAIDTLKRWIELMVVSFRRTLIGRFIVFLSLPLVVLSIYLWKPNTEIPIFDAQVHYNEDAWDSASVKAIINTANAKNVPWMLVCSLPNEGTWRLYEGDPDRVIPMVVPYQTRDERDTWFDDPKNLIDLEQEINSKPYRGIGEFFLFDGQVDKPVVRGMVELARKRRLVLHARSDQFAISQLFALGPDLRILWAHGGMLTQPETIGAMLDRYPQLWVEISHRGDVAPRGKLSTAWKELMLRHPGRFLLGSGTYTMEYWYQFRYYFDGYREWLKELPPYMAEQVAFRNGLELFGLPYREKTKSAS